MKSVFLFAIISLFALPVNAADLDKATYFRLYVTHVDRDTIAGRMIQMFDLLGPTQKEQARTLLLRDLGDVLDELIAANDSRFVAPFEAYRSDVNDTTLP